ncbi:Homeodomain-like protein [Radiomyces spectabilis]|uniref:Homeodomain-like protein n=1 Tax=Radiomyces spectabilis TaxID=64574 RepID=UPI0022210331|nr:Homeodomain-like protein [Radiomyces spectabilis]KAI8373134.1 Homeodomain-like protein [Radiomyces spectabilis]
MDHLTLCSCFLESYRGDHRKILDLEQIEDSVLEKCAVNMFDWQRISSLYVKSRTATECRIQWTTQDHPTINKTPWSRDETQKMDALVEKHGYEGQWETIAVELGTNRTAAQCFAHYQAQKNVGASKRKWTPEDDETLREAVDVFGERNWQQVAVRVGGRTGQQCLQRWTKCVNPAIRRHRWEKEEDDALRAAVNVYGVGNWRIIQRHIPGRTDMQCRERWVNCLDPNLDFTPFNEEEIQRLKELYAIHGRKWSLLAEYFPGHTDNQVLREWKAIERGSRRKKQGDKSSVSSADPQDPPASL